jgi:hypothetical protein
VSAALNLKQRRLTPTEAEPPRQVLGAERALDTHPAMRNRFSGLTFRRSVFALKTDLGHAK